MAKFKVGDMVIGNAKADGRYGITKQGWNGEVVLVREDYILVSHAGGKVYLVKADCFDLYTREKAKFPTVVITTDGETTTAVKREGKRELSRATARCGKGDVFDFGAGARIAFERLLGGEGKAVEKETRGYCGNVICTKSFKGNDDITVGKVYTFVDGYMTDDAGGTRPIAEPVTALDRGWAAAYGFIPFVMDLSRLWRDADGGRFFGVASEWQG